ncbi:MAG: SnoaL-like domain-containing protein [Acidimicrobiia bacterium]|nr:SnoaL-like domain-containing protein [Acidimicrobiia bacterium]
MVTTTPRPTAEKMESGSLTTERRQSWFTPLRAVLVAILALLVAGGVWMLVQGDDAISEETALEELVAQERSVLDPYFADSDPSAYLAMYAEDVTYFDPTSGGRLEGTAARDYLMGFAGLIPPFEYEILDPAVQMSGDTAIFTFGVNIIDPATGDVVSEWTTTEIHERVGDEWEMVHAHWSHPEAAE